MPVARDAVDLLIQAARASSFEGAQHGLRDREWMSLRFLSRANRFSRTPSALASFIGATRTTASQIVKTLETKSYLVRKPSRKDKRSVVLYVTSQGEKVLAQHDPIKQMLDAVAALGDQECARLRDLLRQIRNYLDRTHNRLTISNCSECMFLAERTTTTDGGRTAAEFTCRLHRTPILLEEIELLCANFECASDRPKLDEFLEHAR